MYVMFQGNEVFGMVLTEATGYGGACVSFTVVWASV